jgi:hypothetical protein
LDAGLEPAWATGDGVYGRSSGLREVSEARGIGYVFAVGCDFQLSTSGQVKQPEADSCSVPREKALTALLNSHRATR